MRYDLIIFDCDGVLIDSEPQSARAVQAALREVGRDFDLETVERMFTGDGSEKFRAKITAMGLDADTVSAAAGRHLSAEFSRGVPPVEGMPALLAGLTVPACVASNSGIARLRETLQRLPMAEVFGRHIYSAEHVAEAKPAPDLARHCLTQTGVSAERAVFIDDNIHGILSARACGIHAIGFVQPRNAANLEHIAALQAAGAAEIAIGTEALRRALMAA